MYSAALSGRLTVIANLIQEQDAFLDSSKHTPVDLEAWAVNIANHQNSKPYLAHAPLQHPLLRIKL